MGAKLKVYNFLIAMGSANISGAIAGLGLGGWVYGIIPAFTGPIGRLLSSASSVDQTG